MANIAHASLTGAELHEPKGATTAALGEVYVADGTGSGNWANVGTSSFTGMIADFTWPVVQSGWLELDGSDINTTTYQALYDVMTIQMAGTRTTSSAIITSLSSTANMRVGYYVFGTGIASGTTIASIDSANQITMSAVASSSGTTTVVTSPWLLNTGTIRLPNTFDSGGRYRRSRSSSRQVGLTQTSQNLAHTHDSSGTTSAVSNDHTHTQAGTFTSGNDSPDHTHAYNQASPQLAAGNYEGGTVRNIAQTATNSGGASTRHTHSVTIGGQTGGISANHTHTFSATSSSNGGTETRPTSIVVMTCVKT